MRRIMHLLAAGWLVAASAPALADKVDLQVKFVAPDGTPLAALPVRLAAGPEDVVARPDSGERGETDSDGAFNRQIEVPVEKRRVALDNWFVRHPSNLLRVAIEMELVGRQVLYLIELDQVRDGTAGAMNVRIAGADGRFDTPLTFHGDTHSWSFPDDPAGMRMSSIGADLRRFELLGSAEAGWTAILVVEKQNFTLR